MLPRASGGWELLSQSIMTSCHGCKWFGITAMASCFVGLILNRIHVMHLKVHRLMSPTIVLHHAIYTMMSLVFLADRCVPNIPMWCWRKTHSCHFRCLFHGPDTCKECVLCFSILLGPIGSPCCYPTLVEKMVQFAFADARWWSA